VISGSAAQGQTLTCSSGGWQFSPTSFSFSWKRNAVTTAGTGDRYTLTSGDVGQLVTCQVVATNDAGSGLPSSSLPVTPIAPPVTAVPINVSPPGISGDATAGQTLSCATGAWLNSPTSYAYSWQRGGANLAGQTRSQYVLQTGDVGNPITCTVAASNASGSGPPAVSLPVIPAAAGGGSGAGSGGGSGGGTGSGPSGGSGRPGTGGGSGTGRLPAPHLKSLSVSPKRVLVKTAGQRKNTRGVTIRYSVDRSAAVLIFVQQKRRGRYFTVALITVKKARAGGHRVPYRARRGKKILAFGAYRLIAAAVNPGGWSKARTAPFSVVRRKVKHIG
jgi:hypothetical protein